MKKVSLKMLIVCLLLICAAVLSACDGGAGNIFGNSDNSSAEKFTVKDLSLWYLASDETEDYTGPIKAYSTDEYSTLLLWAQNNEGKLLTSVLQDENKNFILTMNSSQKQELLTIVKQKYEQAMKELPDVCDLFEKAEISETDPREFDIYFDPDAWLEMGSISVAGLLKLENLIILEDYWQFMEELENGSDFVGSIVWKNANTGCKLLTFSSDPEVTSSANFATVAVRHTNYSDYEGTLGFTAKYIGAFTDESYDGTFYEFEVIDDTCYEAGEKVCFHTDSLPVEVKEGDTVYVTFPGENVPSTNLFTSHDQEACFDDSIPYEMQ